MKHKGRESSPYVSIFGKIEIDRVRYHCQLTGNYYPLDTQLNLPSQKYSYLLQDWLAGSACEEAYEQSLGLLNDILGFDFKGMISQRIIQDMGEQVEAYYESKLAPSPGAEGSCLGIGADGKGVRIEKSERTGPVSEEVSQEATRLMKGQKRGTKKEATVCLTFSFDPAPRSPDEVIKDLHMERSPEEMARHKAKLKAEGKKPREAQNTHKRAFMAAQKKALAYGFEQLKKRDPEGKKAIVALIDGGPGLEKGIKEEVEKAGVSQSLVLIILDIIHVSEYVWKAANAILGEKNPQRQAWVRKTLLKILNSKTEQVIIELENAKQGKAPENRNTKTLDSVITYFSNHKHKMDYKTYLGKGYPISTGIVEGCCGHLVKDRMEGSGMRWSLQGAQNMLDCRAVKKNGDWKEFMTFIHNSNMEALLANVA